jgi:methyl-accepting chemotaxis protein
VDEAGKTMQEIVGSVKRVTDIMAEITAASQEQSSGIEQVNTAITQMDEVTQQNAALVEQAAAAAESMEEQAGNLATTVAAFRLERGTGNLEARFDFEQAAKAHADWKSRLYACVEGRGEVLEPEVVASDNRCALGGWMYGAGRRLAKHGEYEALRGTHASFHRCAGEIVTLAQAGQRDQAQHTLANEFVAASKATIDRLYAMKSVAERDSASEQRHAEAAPRRELSKVSALRRPAALTRHPSSKPKMGKASSGADEWSEF